MTSLTSLSTFWTIVVDSSCMRGVFFGASLNSVLGIVVRLGTFRSY